MAVVVLSIFYVQEYHALLSCKSVLQLYVFCALVLENSELGQLMISLSMPQNAHMMGICLPATSC